jgi:hypothetical protein
MDTAPSDPTKSNQRWVISRGIKNGFLGAATFLLALGLNDFLTTMVDQLIAQGNVSPMVASLIYVIIATVIFVILIVGLSFWNIPKEHII